MDKKYILDKLSQIDKSKYSIFEMDLFGSFKSNGIPFSFIHFFKNKFIATDILSPKDLKILNKETIEAMEETNKILNGDIERKSYKNADELFEDLGV